MRKFAFFVAAVVVASGVSVYSFACDKDTQSTTASATSCGAKNVSLASTGKACSAKDAASCNSKMAATCKYHQTSDVALTGTNGCGAHSNAMKASAAACKDGECSDAVFSIASMRGECCVDGVEKALSRVKGVRAVYVDAETHKAYVCTGSAKLDRKAALKSLKNAGFAQAVYSGVDSKHCVHSMSAAEGKSCHPKDKSNSPS